MTTTFNGKPDGLDIQWSESGDISSMSVFNAGDIFCELVAVPKAKQTGATFFTGYVPPFFVEVQFHPNGLPKHFSVIDTGAGNAYAGDSYAFDTLGNLSSYSFNVYGKEGLRIAYDPVTGQPISA